MQKTARTLGIIAGVAGLLGAGFTSFFGVFVAGFGGGAGVFSAGLIAAVLSIFGIVGAVMSAQNPRVSAYVMLIAGIDGLIAISFGYIIAGPLFIIAGANLLRHSKKGNIPVDKKKKYIWLAVGLIIFALIAKSYSSDEKTESNMGGVVTSTDKLASDTNKKTVCPDVVQLPSKFEFKWADSQAGHRNLYLDAKFLLETDFSNNFKLANKPDVSKYSTDSFYCEKGSNSGESLKKLYCRKTYMYEPYLERQDIDEDGNIVSVDTRYIKNFIFDISDKDIERVEDLKSLELESITCSDSYFD